MDNSSVIIIPSYVHMYFEYADKRNVCILVKWTPFKTSATLTPNILMVKCLFTEHKICHFLPTRIVSENESVRNYVPTVFCVKET